MFKDAIKVKKEKLAAKKKKEEEEKNAGKKDADGDTKMKWILIWLIQSSDHLTMKIIIIKSMPNLYWEI